MKTLAIIGGGAAGLAAGVAAGRALRRLSGLAASGAPCGAASTPLRIAVFEADERVGRSILATGNGRCNFSNRSIDASLYHNGEFVADVLLNAGAKARSYLPSLRKHRGVVDNLALPFFEGLGLAWREEAQGRLYPAANKASVVLDVLRSAAEALGVEEHLGARVERVEPAREAGGVLTMRMADGSFERASAVIVACGGAVARDMLPDFFGFEPQRLMLGPIATDTKLVKQLDNIRVRGALELRRNGEVLCCEDGEIMFRKYGVSGIAAFNISRSALPGDDLVIDFMPAWRDEDAVCALNRRRKVLGSLYGNALTCGDMMRGLVLPQVAHVLLSECGLREDALYRRDDATRIAGVLKGFSLKVRGAGDERQCQVRRGGFQVREFDRATLEARGMPGLYAAGEALDVDAPCGGYNLHWAWSSGMLAGWSAVEALTGQRVQPERFGASEGGCA